MDCPSSQMLKVIDISSKAVELIESVKGEKEFFEYANQENAYCLHCSHTGWNLGHIGRFKEGQHYFDKAFSLAREIGHLPTLTLVEARYGGFLNSFWPNSNSSTSPKNALKPWNISFGVQYR